MRLLNIRILFLLMMLTHGVAGQTTPVYDWLLIYYMPYDNNLSPLSSTIVSQLKEYPNSDKVAVVVQTDLADTLGMIRYTFHHSMDSIRISSEDSASDEVFREYLAWASDHFQARHYALILLNHGGRLMEYGLDEYPQERWLSIDHLARSINQFNHREKIAQLDLLFQQVCARGTLENLYEFKDAAAYTLASQGLVPAPGFYYGAMLERLATGTIPSGSALADIIVAAERTDMFYSFSLIDNSRWSDWLSALAGYTHQLQRSKSPVSTTLLKIFSYGGEAYYDFASVLASTAARDEKRAAGKSLSKVTYEKLVCRYYPNNTTDQMIGYSGLSIYSPFRFKPASLSLYANEDYAEFIRTLESLSKLGR